MGARIWSRAVRTAVSAALVGLGVVLGGVFLFAGLLAFASAQSVVVAVILVVVLTELGLVVAALVFLFAADGADGLVRFGLPTREDAGYAVRGTLALYALAAAATAVMAALGESVARFPTEELASAGVSPAGAETALLALVVLSVLVIGPAEELLFRGVVQRYLSGAFSPAGGVVVTSVLFAAVHAPTFTVAVSGAAVWVAAATIFGLSVVLGYLYRRTDNLLVPAVVHGAYDATLFGALYLGLRLGVL